MNPLKILIVDDEELVRRALGRMAERRGHQVQTAEDGNLGLEAWRNWDPDLVLLDVIMPGLRGPEVIRHYGPNPRAKVVLISAYSGDYDIEKARLEGADLFIGKPFSDITQVFLQIEDLAQNPRD